MSRLHCSGGKKSVLMKVKAEREGRSQERCRGAFLVFPFTFDLFPFTLAPQASPARTFINTL
jgi:hypothetical protein